LAAPYLSLRNVVKSYDGQTQAVAGVSIDVARGEFVTLLGPSGSGKTTTLMMIAGFETPSSGVIELNGTDLTRQKPYERNIGVVFQNYALFPHMTVARNVGFPLRMRSADKKDITRRVAAALDMVGLRSFADRHPRELSGGQQQRVALARGLVFDPDLLLLDEPLGALDKNLREQMQVELKRIHQETGVTMLYVTHDQTEAMTMSNRIAVFNHGRLAQVASPLDVYHRPATRFVGAFVGDSNFLPARRVNGQPGVIELQDIGPVQLADTPALPERLEMLVRPERIRVVDSSAPPPDIAVTVQVGAIVNYGDSLLVLGKCGARTLRIRMPSGAAQTLSEGTMLTVGWAVADMMPISVA
jgi:putative spermidine/putrescine transport system ATP-binding protein